MHPLMGWFLLAVGTSTAVVSAFASWLTWGAESEMAGFGSYTLPLALTTVGAVAIAVLGARLIRPPRTTALWIVGAFLVVLGLDLSLRAAGAEVVGDLGGVQLDEGYGSWVPIAVVVLASALAFTGAAWHTHLRRSAVSPDPTP